MRPSTNLHDLLRLGGAETSPARRGEWALQVADLFVLDAPRFADDQIALFDTVLGRLMDGIAETDLASLSERLALVSNAPEGVIERLAFDDSIAVSRPVLTFSLRLDDPRLVRRSLTGHQGHLSAIAGRKSLSEPITELLINRGEVAVLRRVVANSGARLSIAGCTALIERAGGDDALSLALADRRDLPAALMPHFLQMASSAVRARLESSGCRGFDDVRRLMVVPIADDRTTAAHASRRDAIQAKIEALHRIGKLDEAGLRHYTKMGAQEHVVAALAALSGLTPKLIESARDQPRQDGVLVITRALDLSWETTRAILNLKVPGGLSCQALEQAVFGFERLTVETARLALRVQRRRAG